MHIPCCFKKTCYAERAYWARAKILLIDGTPLTYRQLKQKGEKLQERWGVKLDFEFVDDFAFLFARDFCNNVKVFLKT